jgi:hypothetical protein
LEVANFFPMYAAYSRTRKKATRQSRFRFVKVGAKSWQCLDTVIEALFAKYGQGAMTPGNVSTTVELKLCPSWYVRRHPP